MASMNGVTPSGQGRTEWKCHRIYGFYSTDQQQGWRKHLSSGQAKSSTKVNGALACNENFEFNYIHDYDVIRFALKRGSSKFNRFQRAYSDQMRGMVRICNIQSKHEDVPFVLWIIFAINEAKKWSGQNLTSRTSSAAYEQGKWLLRAILQLFHIVSAVDYLPICGYCTKVINL